MTSAIHLILLGLYEKLECIESSVVLRALGWLIFVCVLRVTCLGSGPQFFWLKASQ
jgi:hypothetical protein